jgi:hypothetical protein
MARRPAVKCSAKSRRTGEPCKKFAIHGGTVCDSHGGRAPQAKRNAAERVAEAQFDRQQQRRYG